MAMVVLLQIGYLMLTLMPMILQCRPQDDQVHSANGHLNGVTANRETIFPTRLSGSEWIKNHRVHKRDLSSKYNQDVVSFKFQAYGRQYLLDLSFNKDFISPNVVVERHDGNLTWVEEGFEGGLSDCFYTGKVNNDSSSRSVFNLCNGLRGIFHHEGDVYLLEPCTDCEEAVHNSKPHYIYKQAHNKHSIDKESHCALQENYKHTRRKENRDKSVISRENVYSRDNNSYVNSFNQFHETHHHSVHKRSASLKRHVEVMVAADYLMYRYHGADLMNYVLTLMAIVNSIYKDPSIGNFINIAVVKINVFKSEEDGPRISANAAQSLEEFCKWQYSHNIHDDTHPQHYDTAVLLTRTNICRTHAQCDTLGLAELGTICDPLRSCSIIEDNGISAAYTIAHELGHVFDLPHDDNSKCKDYIKNKKKDHVMSPTLDHNTSPWTWSTCSSSLLTQFIDSGSAECLLDRPRRRSRYRMTRTQSIAPGQIYDINKQCELMFGHGFKLCSFSPDRDCKRLWCVNGKNKGCKTLHMPWADGTSCGTNKWCRHGVCRPEKALIPINGGWGRWQMYGKCSRTCGGGIKEAIRKCSNPVPAHGGRYCTGRRVRYRSCNTKTCPENVPDFRGLQCKEFDGTRKIHGLPSNVHWVPKYAGIRLKDACKLYCRVHTGGAYYLLKDKVIDGTKCGPNIFDVCINGKCRNAGCDNRLGSRAKIDRCGVCGGDNSTCIMSEVKRRYFNNAKYGYNYVARIPQGAKNIIIEQSGHMNLKEDGNYLALKNSSGHYILNGHFIVNTDSRKIKVKGASLLYSGSDSVVEKINSTGPLGENITVEVLSVGKHYPPNIEYSYTMSIESHFVWSHGAWSDCSRICEGTRQRRLICVSDDKERIQVSDSKCLRQRSTKPKKIEDKCNTDCKLRWKVNQEECSARCGEGMAIQKVQCVTRNIWGLENEVAERECEHLGPRPGDVVSCFGKCLPTHWQYTEWSECTKTCNGGQQTRRAKCTDVNRNELPEKECQLGERVISRACNEEPCPDWRTFTWTGCSHTCGSGTRHRKVYCYHGERKVDDMYCTDERKPIGSELCNRRPCPEWRPRGWGLCSVSCGTGVSKRLVDCRHYNGEILRPGMCDPSSKPYNIRTCYMGPCPTTTTTTTTTTVRTTSTTATAITTTPPHPTTSQPSTLLTTTTTTTTSTPRPVTMTMLTVQWTTSQWSECSSTCGEGHRTRSIICQDTSGKVVSSALCVNHEQPITREQCVSMCGIWRSGSWGECSMSCGEGERTRQVACFKLDHHRGNDEECDMSSKPEMRRKCNRGSCPEVKDYEISAITSNNVEGTSHWRVGPWSDCSVTCGPGWKRRQVVCQDERGDSDKCDYEQRPPDTEACDSSSCGTWTTGMWSKCSVACGGDGEESRQVLCQMGDRTIADNMCNVTQRPPHRRLCNNGACSSHRRWYIAPWAPCSITCGRGHQQREVMCVDEDNIPHPQSECQGKKPRNTRLCKMGKCPRWKTGHWSKCSVTCGTGVRMRDVKCKARHHWTVDQAFCANRKKPKAEEFCQRKPCSDFAWKKGEWSECSMTCGFGTKTRTVSCIDRTGRDVSKDHCSETRTPKSRRRCSEFPCPYIWNTSPWTECNSTCGAGVQKRNVICQAVTKEGWILPGEVPYGCRPEEKPELIRSCNLGECGSQYHWVVGPWGQCSSRCGWGLERRLVICVDILGRRRSKKQCPHEIKPDAKQSCYSGPCYADSCEQLKKKTSIRHDDMYSLLVQGRIIQVYCKNMRKALPVEYLTLSAGESENYSEIYAKRLRHPRLCPNDGKRHEKCPECRNTLHKESGNTSYSKVRIDISTLKVLTSDTTFATVNSGKRIPFGTAGDCYSAQGQCPQGRFNINLTGTGFIVSSNTTWVSHGQHASKKIEILQNGEIVRGICGGHCGVCSPDIFVGLQLEVKH